MVVQELGAPTSRSPASGLVSPGVQLQVLRMAVKQQEEHPGQPHRGAPQQLAAVLRQTYEPALDQVHPAAPLPNRRVLVAAVPCLTAINDQSGPTCGMETVAETASEVVGGVKRGGVWCFTPGAPPQCRSWSTDLPGDALHLQALLPTRPAALHPSGACLVILLRRTRSWVSYWTGWRAPTWACTASSRAWAACWAPSWPRCPRQPPRNMLRAYACRTVLEADQALAALRLSLAGIQQ